MAGITNDPLLTTILIVAALLTILGLAAILAPQIDVRSLRQIGRLFVGYKVPPALVALARRGATALVALLLFRFGGVLGMEELQDKALASVAAASVVEFAWGLLDQLRKPNQNAIPPPPPT